MNIIKLANSILKAIRNFDGVENFLNLSELDKLEYASELAKLDNININTELKAFELVEKRLRLNY